MKNFIVAAALVLTMMTATVALASNEAPKPVYDSASDPEWVAFINQTRTQNRQWLKDQAHCAETWDMLWPWAKKGNYEARGLLLALTVSMMHMNSLVPPGSDPKNRAAHDTDIIIMGAHTMPLTKKDSPHLFLDPDSGEEYPGANFPFSYATYLIENRRLPNEKKQPYLDCLKETPSHACADIAVKDGLVPSFEEYAAKIDALMAKGIKASCIIDGYAESQRNSVVISDSVDTKPKPK